MIDMRFIKSAFLFLACGLLLLSACKTAKTTSGNSAERELQALMAGTYSSKLQSERDTDYYHIALKMIPIWQKKPGTWLYVEQAMASKPDKPYRVRMYQLVANADGSFISKVFMLKNEKDAIGKWSNVAWFDQFNPEQILEDRAGCGVQLTKRNKTTYDGGTIGKDCASTLRGATYAVSKVTIEKDKIVSWDQGFDAADKQVWGAEKGGYIFMKE
jgi:CpeT protein